MEQNFKRFSTKSSRMAFSGILVVSAAMILTMASARAEVCVFPDFEEVCAGDDCALDFTDDNSDNSFIQSDVLLDERRARAHAEGGLANTNRAVAEVGIRFRLAVDMDVDLSARGSFRGLLDGGAGQAFGNFRVGLILRDVDEDDILINQELAAQEKESGGPTLGVQGNVEGDISQLLLADKTYALSLQIRTAARGLGIAESNFSGANGGVVFEGFSIKGVSRVADTDGDKLPDIWETEGVRNCDDQLVLNLPALGADPNRQDLFVEVDWLEGSPPSKLTVATVKSAFLHAPANAGGSGDADQPGIMLHVDTGKLHDPARRESQIAPPFSCDDGMDNGDGDGTDADDPDCRIGDNLGGGEEIPLAEVPNFSIDAIVPATVPGLWGDGDGSGRADFFELKEKFFNPARRFAFRYAIFTEQTDRESAAGLGLPGTPSPTACTDGFDNDNDGAIDEDDKDDCFSLGGQARGVNFVMVNDTAVTFMHELGHTLGLGHGGPTFFTEQDPAQFDINCKPNYLSIMNYSLSGAGTSGIRQSPQDVDGDGTFDTGQDLDGDGLSDGRIIDFSPPRFVTFEDGQLQFGRSIIDSLPTLQESCLDRTQALDPSDPQNNAPFTNGLGIDLEAPVDEPIDWQGFDPSPDNPFDETCFAVNLNGFAQRCKTDPAQNAMQTGQNLGGANDWRNIVFNPRSRGEGDPQEADIVEPTISEIEAAKRLRDQADLAITQTIEPAPAIAGQPLTITLTIENFGPRQVAAAQVVDQIPSDIEVVALDDRCTEYPENTVTCRHGDFWPGDERSFAIEGRLRADLACHDRQFIEINNTATVENVHGLDPNAENDADRQAIEILCIRYEFPAKIVCGQQNDRQLLGLLAGRYGTTVNVHNPNDERISLFAKFAAASGPGGGAQLPRSLPLGLFKLSYDESLAVDCDAVRNELSEGTLPGDLVEGYLVVQSPRRLDVDAVYTTAGLETATPPGINSADVEPVRGRDRTRLKRPLPDLSAGLSCGAPPFLNLTVANDGEGDAEPHILSVQFDDFSLVNLKRPMLRADDQVSLSVPIPDECRSGCEVTAIADADGVIDEADEHNNLANGSCTIGRGPGARR